MSSCEVFILSGLIIVAVVVFVVWRLSKHDYEIDMAVRQVKLKRKKDELEKILGVDFFGGVASGCRVDYQQKQIELLSRKAEELTASLKGIRSSLERVMPLDDALDCIEARLQLLEQPKPKKKDKK